MVSREMPFKFSIAAPMTLVHNSVNFRSLRLRLQRFVFETMSLENIPLRKLDFFKKFTPEYSLLRESRTRRLKRLNLRSATFLSPRPSRERERERERDKWKERKKEKETSDWRGSMVVVADLYEARPRYAASTSLV